MIERYSHLKRAGFIKCGGGEYVQYSDYAALEAQLAEAKAERDEYYARGFGLRSHVVRYLNRNVSKETLREAFMRWESASGTRFSISPAALEATPAPVWATGAKALVRETHAGLYGEYTPITVGCSTAALEAQLAERVRVKPLVWKELPGNQHCNIAFTADTIGGSFVIEERAGDTFDLWRMGQEIARRFGTLDEAKAAAQDWHNNAVAEVLEATPAPMVTEAKVDDALAAFESAGRYASTRARIKAALTAAQGAPKVTEERTWGEMVVCPDCDGQKLMPGYDCDCPRCAATGVVPLGTAIRSILDDDDADVFEKLADIRLALTAAQEEGR